MNIIRGEIMKLRKRGRERKKDKHKLTIWQYGCVRRIIMDGTAQGDEDWDRDTTSVFKTGLEKEEGE